MPDATETSPLNLMKLYRLIWRGSFPVTALGEQGDRDLFYSSTVHYRKGAKFAKKSSG